VTQTICLPVECGYTFTINDSYGDGICCAHGNGSYNVKNAAGTVLFSGGSFTSTVSHALCVTSSARPGVGFEGDEMVDNKNFLHPNPVRDVLHVTLPEDVTVNRMKIITMTGSTQYQLNRFEKDINVSSLPAGFYILHMDTNRGLLWNKFSKE
jgi:hypothetical protein